MDGLAHDSDNRASAIDADDSELLGRRPIPVEAIIRKYTPMVRGIACALGFHRPIHLHTQGMEVEDAMQAGMIGLYLAVLDYNEALVGPNLKNPFGAYAAIRIRKEILNEISRNRWFSGENVFARRCRVYTDYIDRRFTGPADDYLMQEEWFARLNGCACDLDAPHRHVLQNDIENNDLWMNNDYRGRMEYDKSGNPTASRVAKPKVKNDIAQALGVSKQTISNYRKEIRKKLGALH